MPLMSTTARSPFPFPPKRLYLGRTVPMRVIRRYARAIADEFQPDRIILFGSYAYGMPHADSDVDLLVVIPAKPAQPSRPHSLATVGALSARATCPHPQANVLEAEGGRVNHHDDRFPGKRSSMKKMTREWVERRSKAMCRPSAQVRADGQGGL
jgi:Nucleotidyltransferase domain